MPQQTPRVDYAALAKQAGSVSSGIPPAAPAQDPYQAQIDRVVTSIGKGAPVDYAALARQAGAVTSSPPDHVARSTTSTTSRTWVDSLTDYASNLWQGVNPMNLVSAPGAVVSAAGDVARDIVGTAKQGQIGQAALKVAASPSTVLSKVTGADQVREKAEAAFKKGNYLEGARHLFDYIIPFIGPLMDRGVDQLQQGNTAAGLGTLSSVVAQAAGPKVLAAGASRVASRLGPALDRIATEKLTDVMSPKVGPNKLKFGAMAESAAPEIARAPKLGSFTKAGFSDKIDVALADAGSRLEQAYDAIPKTKMFPTTPIIKGLQVAREKLTVSGIGGTVDPATRASRLKAIDRAIQEVKSLGSLANVDNLRKLKQSWGEGGRLQYTPVVAQDAFKARAAGSGWADAEGVLRNYMVTKEPRLAAPNHEVSLYLDANRAMQAAIETQRTRPTLGRRLAEGLVGLTAGQHVGGPGGAAAGAVIVPIVDAAAQAVGFTTKIRTARALARFADALERGRAVQARGHLLQAARTAGVSAPVLLNIRRLFETPSGVPVPATAQSGSTPPKAPEPE